MIRKKRKRRKKRGGAKGGAFERTIAKQLSSWWSRGKRDDIFWRSQTSGGRATQRAKEGKKTFGQNGDIAAVDPIGAKLLQAFAIELKTGYVAISFADILDWNRKTCCLFEEWIQQAQRAMQNSGSESWMLIVHRTGRKDMILIPTHTWLKLQHFAPRIKRMRPQATIVLPPRDNPTKRFVPRAITGTLLSNFLKYVDKAAIRAFLKDQRSSNVTTGSRSKRKRETRRVSRRSR